MPKALAKILNRAIKGGFRSLYVALI